MVLDDDSIEHGDVETDKDGQRSCYSETVIHVLLCDLFGLFEVVTVFDLLLDSVGVTQEADYLVSVGATGDLFHDVIAEVACQTVEDWVFGEVDELISVLVIGYLDLEQAFLEVGM